MFKELYSFTVTDSKEVEEKTKEKRKNQDGVEEEVEVTKKVKKDIPYKVIIKDPSRRQLEEADMEYSIEMSNCIKKGILTKAMLAKKYSDTGGMLSESDANRLVELYAELADLEGEYTRRTLKHRNTKKLPKDIKAQLDDIAAKIAIARRDIVTLESSYQTLFGHTADTKDDYYIKDERENSLFQLASGKLTSIISYWYFSNDPAKEDFDKIINDIDNPS